MPLRLDDSRLSEQEEQEAIEIYIELRRQGLSCTENDIQGVKLNRRCLAIRSETIAGLSRQQTTMATTNERPPGGSGIQNQPHIRGEDDDTVDQAETALEVLAAAQRAPRLPLFYKDDPEFWFGQLESTFQNHRITRDESKFSHLMANAAPELQPYLAGVYREVVPPNSSRYELFKTRVIQGFATSEEAKFRKLMTGQCLGDKKPSQFLAILKTMAPVACGDTVMKSLFREQLPDNVRSILSVLPTTTTIDEMAVVADRLMESNPPPAAPQMHAVEVQAVSKHDVTLTEQVKELRAQMAQLTRWMKDDHHARRQQRHDGRSRSRHRSQSRQHFSNRGHSDKSKLCYYHEKFGKEAEKCRSPCAMASGN